ncbi:MAG: hypothetical protein ACOC87_04325 [Candidatus Natronoplasma sp.]
MQRKSEERRIAVDTSALISLAVGSKLEKCLEIFDIVISERVREELEEISEYSDKHAEGAELVLEIISNGGITVESVTDDSKVSELLVEHRKLDYGEAETALMAERNSIPIMITDDFKSLGDLKESFGRIKIHLSVFAIGRLVVKDKISKDEAETALEKIAKERSWEGAALFRHAKRYIEDL